MESCRKGRLVGAGVTYVAKVDAFAPEEGIQRDSLQGCEPCQLACDNVNRIQSCICGACLPSGTLSIALSMCISSPSHWTGCVSLTPLLTFVPSCAVPYRAHSIIPL